MNEAEKDMIVDEVLTRINEMSEEDKKQRSVLNRKIMNGLSDYYSQKYEEYDKSCYKKKAAMSYIDGPLTWNAYYRVRELIPWIVSVRYGNEENWDAFYKAYPGAQRRGTHSSVVNPMLEEDKDLALAIGRDLIDILFKYLRPDGWDEAKTAAEREAETGRSPFAKRRR